MCRLRDLGWLLRASYTLSTWTCITPWQASHGMLLLLLHLEVMLLLKPLLECLLLGHGAWVALPLLARWTTRLLGTKRRTSRRTLSHSGRLHPRLSHESLALWWLWLLKLTMINTHLLLLLLLLLKMPSHEQVSKLRIADVSHLWPLDSSPHSLLLLLLLQSCNLLLL